MYSFDSNCAFKSFPGVFESGLEIALPIEVGRARNPPLVEVISTRGRNWAQKNAKLVLTFLPISTITNLFRLEMEGRRERGVSSALVPIKVKNGWSQLLESSCENDK